jgi:predicted dehydrogenase
MLSVAMVGVGQWGRAIVAAIAGTSERVRIRRVVDCDPGAAAQVAASLGCPWSARLDDALADPGIDALVLATPHSLHVDQIEAGSRAGKHVFTDKPLALTRLAAQRAVDATRAAGVLLGLGHNQRFARPQSEIGRMLAAGELGVPMHLEGNTSHDFLAEVKGWRHDPAEAPSGGLVHMGSHLIDLFTDWVGPVASVYAQAADRVIARDSASALLTFACGATGYVGNVTVTAASRHLQAFGSGGWARVLHPDGLEVCLRGGAPERRDFAPVNTVRANLENFADAIAGRSPYRFAPEQMVHDAAVLEALTRSLQSGRREAVV